MECIYDTFYIESIKPKFTPLKTNHWEEVAGAVGLLVLGVVAFCAATIGVAGLLHAHGLLGFLQWLPPSAVGTIGSTQYMGFLALASVGLLSGGMLTVGSIVKMVKVISKNEIKKENLIENNNNNNKIFDEDLGDKKDSKVDSKKTSYDLLNSPFVSRDAKILGVKQRQEHSEVPKNEFYYSEVRSKSRQPMDVAIMIVNLDGIFHYFRGPIIKAEDKATQLRLMGFSKWVPERKYTSVR